jgi:signal transduction histidine kinase
VPNRELFDDLSHRILDAANRFSQRIDFLREVTKLVVGFSGCNVVELWVEENEVQSRCEARRHPKESFRFEMTRNVQNGTVSRNHSHLERLSREILSGHFDPSLPFFTERGSFWTGNSAMPVPFTWEIRGETPAPNLCIRGKYASLALIPIAFGGENVGLLQLKSERPDHISEDMVRSYERVAQSLSVALTHQKAQAALLERVKELTCLYGIARIAAEPSVSLEEVLKRVVDLLPPAWQYPDIACARIVFDGRSHSTPGFRKSQQRLAANILVRAEPRGTVEVGYRVQKPELDENPFLREEQNLIETVSKQLGLIIEQRRAEEDRSRLHDQLRHADRLATIGQLSAGVAHELNEPLSSILGFAQLLKKSQDLPRQAVEDIEKIVTASLHAREIIKKLMLFARQTPPRKTQVNLNQVIEEGLYFLEARCSKAGIKVERSLLSDLPGITADPAQMNQVLVNLVVNSLQAMPEGGKLTVQTRTGADHVSLIVEDTGAGMTEAVKKQIFIPFFTTKDVDQGTGLGLAMVHGIVTAHGGSINVESTVGRGTRFEIRVPIKETEEVEERTRNG